MFIPDNLEEGRLYPVVYAMYMAVEGNPHFVSPMWAYEVFSFFKNFSRDPESGKLVVEQN